MRSCHLGRVARLAAAMLACAMLAGPALAAATYTIQKGGSLHDVSKRTGVPVKTLAALNGIKDPSAQLPKGRVVKLAAAPAPKAAPAKPKATAAKPKAAPAKPKATATAATPKAAPAATRAPLPSRGDTMREVLAERRYLAEKARKAAAHAALTPAAPKPAAPKPVAPAPADPTPDAAAATRGEQLVAAAREWTGTPYLYGGMNRAGIDCSGLVVRAAETLGVKLPHRSATLFTMGTKVTYRELKPGDLVFFVTRGDGVSHVGIYVGNDKFIHASSKYGVREQAIAGYYSDTLCGARRILD